MFLFSVSQILFWFVLLFLLVYFLKLIICFPEYLFLRIFPSFLTLWLVFTGCFFHIICIPDW